ncbi:SAM-dependent DNA methyltransferase [Microbacteriaceae bacterium VKM Ac-2855]|nr:SAM-dependent DNA methyltransferase [Microbacteriaceae bacterium VKM Ac-2855]
MVGELRPQVDKVWNAFWSGGIANPLEVIEQITYLLFIRRLDENQALAERASQRTGKPIASPVFPEGESTFGRTPRPFRDLRWSVFTQRPAAEMFEIVDEHVFPFIRSLGADGSSFAANMKDARFTIPSAALLEKVVDLLKEIPMESRDTKGDIYEYMLGKLATSGQNGQFRTARHVIEFMVDMMAPTPDDIIIDPASGTAGFLVVAQEYVRKHHPELWQNPKQAANFNGPMFTGFDSDASMARIGSMNMLLHGIENPTIRRQDSLAEEHYDAVADAEGRYSMVLANPPFAGSLDYDTTAKDLLGMVKTKKTELLFLALMVRLLKNGGRAAVIVPDGVLFGSSNAHKALRRILVEDQQLQAVVKLPSGTFKPYTGVSTAILFFTKTSSGGTDQVWFYDVRADGMTLDDKRTPVEANDLPDALARWQSVLSLGAESSEYARARTEQSFFVPVDEIREQGYDLSLNRYREIVHEDVEHQDPAEILARLRELEQEIAAGLNRLIEELGR